MAEENKRWWLTKWFLNFLAAFILALIGGSVIYKIFISNPTFNGPTQIGNQNVQNINEGPKQRMISVADIKFITANIGDSIKTIYIMRRVSDNETYNYGKSIVGALKVKGYKVDLGNVALDGPERTYPNDPERNEKAKHVFQFDTAGTQLNIYVPLHE